MLHFLDLLGKNGTHGTQPEPSMGPAGVPVINKSEQWVTEPKKDGTHGTLKNYQSVEMPPCPGDEAERIAFLVQEGVPDSSDAERMALSEPCFDGWHAFAAAHADAVTAELDRLPVPSSWDGAALLRITRAFIPSPWNLLAVRHGWATHELFGVHPYARAVRVDAFGLVSSIVLSPHIGIRLESLAAYGATLAHHSRSRLRFRRLKPGIDCAEPWWYCEALFSREVRAATAIGG